MDYQHLARGCYLLCVRKPRCRGPLFAQVYGCLLAGNGEGFEEFGQPGWHHAASHEAATAHGSELIEWEFVHGDNDPDVEWRFAGFQFVVGPEGFSTWCVVIPHWFLFTITGVGLSFSRIRARFRSR
jgi:hypothetical protein